MRAGYTIDKEGHEMRDEYEIANLHPRQNPYAKKGRRQISINIDEETVQYFQKTSLKFGIPYQVLINLYLSDCVRHKREPEVSWK